MSPQRREKNEAHEIPAGKSETCRAQERKVWEFRWREVQLDGSIRRKNIVIGTLDEYRSESAAQSAADSIRLTINRQTQTQAQKQASVEALVKHYREHDLPEIYHDRLPEPGERDDHQKAYSTQYAYEVYLQNWILNRAGGPSG